MQEICVLLIVFAYLCEKPSIMLKQERHQLILDKLNTRRKVLSVVLSRELDVSEDTIRRDLKELEAKNLLYKVHGGALSMEAKIKTFDERSHSDINEKKKIAKKAVRLIRNGQVIFMSGSSTNVEIAKLLPPDINATIFTFSLPVALQLSHHPSAEIIFLGGKLNKSALVSTGIDVVNAMSELRVDICFMGVAAIDHDHGITESDWEVAHIKKKMIGISDYVIAMCTGKTLHTSERYLVESIKKIDTLITDFNTDNTVFKSFKEQGIVVI